MENLRLLRKRNHISQTELGNVLGLTQRAISAYESGVNEPDLKTLIKMANYFNVSIDYLLGNTDENLIIITKKELSELKDSLDTINSIYKKLSSGISITLNDEK